MKEVYRDINTRMNSLLIDFNKAVPNIIFRNRRNHPVIIRIIIDQHNSHESYFKIDKNNLIISGIYSPIRNRVEQDLDEKCI